MYASLMLSPRPRPAFHCLKYVCATENGAGLGTRLDVCMAVVIVHHVMKMRSLAHGVTWCYIVLHGVTWCYMVLGCVNEQLLLGLMCYYLGFEANDLEGVVWRDILLLVRGEPNATFCWFHQRSLIC